ncbi:MAG: twin-arginine translocation signal domain-containing protein [Chloroflexi bacterium]|nr:twin-arginine translocation signal domain-containing protein [Chloroflexota bacterium]
MPETAPEQPAPILRMTTTRRQMLKLSAAAGAALAATYVAPSFTTVGVQRAFAQVTGGGVPCQLCLKIGKPSVLTMKLLGASAPAAEGNDQEGKVQVKAGNSNLVLPATVWVRASSKSNSFDSRAIIWFQGLKNVGSTFDIESAAGVKNNGDLDPKSNLSSDTYVSYFTPGPASDPDQNVAAGNELQTVCFHTSCSVPINIGDRYVSVQLIDFIGENGVTKDRCADIVCETGMKPDTLTMKFMGSSISEDLGHSQDLGKVNVLNGTDPSPVFTNKVFIESTGFSGYKNKFESFTIDSGGAKLASSTVVTIWNTDIFGVKTGPVVQEFEFHTSCSQPLLVGDQFISVKLQSATLLPK